ncbi:Dienelactone hydrolase family protein [Roseivivax sp. THAF40]|uniref:dienelactone hydrolase family protein n=1 Tax=unclassified Roseivivax TaxID=2639302 RepID=UPI0012685953|nr:MULTISPECIES: dienelactone hydrolase family protein [unclassified Roseivivax]QFS84389.1 Dienelactone hydrolase family protein [Roseivivax sp. THAF197b]QFT48217.1 Dienelactone hydrolase family protein [Roseivivax sp. THAF40]
MIRTAFIALPLIASAGLAGAEITGESYRYSVGGTEFEGYVARNSDLEETKGTVLIVHDWDGMTAYEERRAEMLAAAGYTAFAIDVYGADENPQSVDENRALSGALYQDRELFRERLMGSIAEAANIPGATGNIVIAGYCFGGAAVLEAARAGAEIDGFAAFHAGLGTPEGQDYSATTAPIVLFHGSADPVSGMDEMAAALSQMQEAGVTHDARIFGGARHSFTVWGSDDYDLAADEGSWDGFMDFLDAQL